jgi:cell division protein FtsL
MVIIGIGTLVLSALINSDFSSNIRTDIIGLVLGIILLVLCTPSLVVVWHNIRSLVDEATTYVLRRRQSTKQWRLEALRIVLRDSIVIAISIFIAIWFIPLLASLLSIGSYAIVIPILLLTVLLYLLLNSIRHIHGQLELNFSRVILGAEHSTTIGTAASLDTKEGRIANLLRKIRRRKREQNPSEEE